jgi:hypothetical protein
MSRSSEQTRDIRKRNGKFAAQYITDMRKNIGEMITKIFATVATSFNPTDRSNGVVLS